MNNKPTLIGAIILALALCGTAAALRQRSTTQNQSTQCPCGMQQGQGPMQGLQTGKDKTPNQTLQCPCGMQQAQGRMQGMMGQPGPQMQDMQTIHELFAEHQRITRSVKNIDNGVETITESDDPKVQALISEHAWAMHKRIASKQPIRIWDPLFAELFKYSEKINMEITKTAKGVKVVETSTDPYVVKLLQAHALAVSEFASEGPSSMHKAHALPDATADEKGFAGRGDGITTCPVTGAPVNKTVSAEINGKTVYFCCPACRDAVKQNPERYLKP